MARKIIGTGPVSVSTTAVKILEGDADWAEIDNPSAVTVYGKHNDTATAVNYDFVIQGYVTKTFDKGFSGYISLITSSGTATITAEKQ